MFYINYRTSAGVETVDQFDTRKEARAMLTEYVLAYQPGANLYISTRPTRAWKAAS